MADEYIKRKDLEKWIRTEMASLDTEDDREFVIERLRKEIPAADVQPVRHGRWIWDNDAIDWGLGAWVCSECHGRNENIHAGKPGYDHTIGMSPYSWAGSAYCPNCGALMKENADVPTTD